LEKFSIFGIFSLFLGRMDLEVLALSTGLGDGVEEEARHGEVVGEESV
jgi:hypothetical protein